jgi:short-subunit dehydrogenase
MSSHRSILLTGASRGLGVAIANDLARDGARLLLTARDAAALDETWRRVNEAGGSAQVVAADLATPEGRAALLAAVAEFGRLDAAIFNAGVEIPVAFAEQTEADIVAQIRLNLESPLLLARALLPAMIERRAGALAFIASMSGKSPTPYNAVYTATKHGLVGLVSSLRIELEGTGVTAGVVCPSFVADAGMWASTGVKAPRAMREVPLAAVNDGVRAVLAGAGEVLVTPGPVRPLLAIAQLIPSLQGRVLHAMGVLDALKQRAEVTKSRRQP